MIGLDDFARLLMASNLHYGIIETGMCDGHYVIGSIVYAWTSNDALLVRYTTSLAGCRGANIRYKVLKS